MPQVPSTLRPATRTNCKTNRTTKEYRTTEPNLHLAFLQQRASQARLKLFLPKTPDRTTEVSKTAAPVAKN